jgi:hypothetical protein
LATTAILAGDLNLVDKGLNRSITDSLQLLICSGFIFIIPYLSPLYMYILASLLIIPEQENESRSIEKGGNKVIHSHRKELVNTVYNFRRK